jgi:spectinomycin phosphotransferase
MKVKFYIEDSMLISTINADYGIGADSLSFIPLGDSAYSYKISCEDGQRYYLKLFDHDNRRQRMGMERLNDYLTLTWKMYHERLFRNITYPIKNQNGDFKTTFDGITVVLFNFIDGETLADSYPFSDVILEEIAKSVAIFQQITPLINTKMLSVESFDISFETDLKKCISELENTSTFDNSITQTLREQVLLKKEGILDLLNYLPKLRNKSLSDPKEMVLCHSDIWGGNLIRCENELYFIDWESAIIAAPELDLVGYIGEGFDVFLSAYEQSWGKSIALNPDILRFYAYRHHLRNLTNWITNILYQNREEAQNENDLEMILHHCMNRWERIELDIKNVENVIACKRTGRN